MVGSLDDTYVSGNTKGSLLGSEDDLLVFLLEIVGVFSAFLRTVNTMFGGCSDFVGSFPLKRRMLSDQPCVQLILRYLNAEHYF